MANWSDQLDGLPDFSNEEKDHLFARLSEVRDPDSFFAQPDRAVGRLKALLDTKGRCDAHGSLSSFSWLAYGCGICSMICISDPDSFSSEPIQPAVVHALRWPCWPSGY